MSEKTFAQEIAERAAKMRTSRQQSQQKQTEQVKVKKEEQMENKENKKISVREMVENIKKIEEQEKKSVEVIKKEIKVKTKEQIEDEKVLKEFVKEAVEKTKENMIVYVKESEGKQLQKVVNDVDTIIPIVDIALQKNESLDNVKESINEVSEKMLKGQSKNSKIYKKIKNLFKALIKAIEKVWNLCISKKKMKEVELDKSELKQEITKDIKQEDTDKIDERNQESTKQIDGIKEETMKEVVEFIASIAQVAQRQETHKGLGKRLARKFEEIGSDNKIFEKGSKENEKFMAKIKDAVGRDGEHYDEKIAESLISKMQGEIKKMETLSKNNPAKDEIKMS